MVHFFRLTVYYCKKCNKYKYTVVIITINKNTIIAKTNRLRLYLTHHRGEWDLRAYGTSSLLNYLKSDARRTVETLLNRVIKRWNQLDQGAVDATSIKSTHLKK